MKIVHNDKILVCYTRFDVEKAKREYLKKKRLRLTLVQCIFQKKHQHTYHNYDSKN